MVCSLKILESTLGETLHQWSAVPMVTGATGGAVAYGSGDGKGAGAMNTMLIVSADRLNNDSGDYTIFWVLFLLKPFSPILF